MTITFNQAQLGSIVDVLYFLGSAIIFASVIRGLMNR